MIMAWALVGYLSHRQNALANCVSEAANCTYSQAHLSNQTLLPQIPRVCITINAIPQNDLVRTLCDCHQPGPLSLESIRHSNSPSTYDSRCRTNDYFSSSPSSAAATGAVIVVKETAGRVMSKPPLLLATLTLDSTGEIRSCKTNLRL